MEDDRNRLSTPLKSGWNLIFEGILDQNQDSQLLGENHRAIHSGLDELKQNLYQLSQYRHTLNCRLEAIKREIEKLHLQAIGSAGPDKIALEHSILKLEEEGYSLQVELEGVEHRLKQIRSHERNSNSVSETETPA